MPLHLVTLRQHAEVTVTLHLHISEEVRLQCGGPDRRYQDRTHVRCASWRSLYCRKRAIYMANWTTLPASAVRYGTCLQIMEPWVRFMHGSRPNS